MPWTLSHPAVVLPLRCFSPQPLDFAALVAGSMTPDFGYYIGRFDFAYFAHTFPGSFIACLPTGVIFLLTYYFFCKPVCYALPSPHRQSLLPLCPVFPTDVTRWAIIMLSLLLGAWTHNVWDAFTHEHGWFVARIPCLQQPVLRLLSTPVCVFLVLQELSTVIGFAVLVIAYAVWLHRRRSDRSADSEPDGWRYLLWIAILVISLLITLPPAIHFASSFHDLRFYRSLAFQTAISFPALAIPLSLFATTVIYARRDKKT